MTADIFDALRIWPSSDSVKSNGAKHPDL